MTDIQAFAIERFGSYASALALTMLLLSGCSSTKPAVEPIQHVTTLREVHREYHKKMLASQKVRNPKN